MHRILVIDDDMEVGTRMAHTLQQAGFYAMFHRGPFGTLNAVRESRCDLILLDVSMPKLDGASIVRMVRDTFLTNRIRVVLFSNMEIGALRRLASWMNVHEAISKRASDADVVAQIQDVLGRPTNERRGSARRSTQDA